MLAVHEISYIYIYNFYIKIVYVHVCMALHTMLTNVVCNKAPFIALAPCLVVHLVMEELLSVSSIIIPDFLQCHPSSWCMAFRFCNNALQFLHALRVVVDHPCESHKFIVLLIVQGNAYKGENT